jgi:S-adenosylmethionine-diacylglycerol 3-amino-3-carboxypropyl transferase
MNNQNDFYDNVWNHWRWKLMFKLCFNKLTIKNFARAPGSFDGVERISSSKHYYLRTQHALINTPINNNYFLNYILIGKYGSELPEYLKQENFLKLKQLVDRVELISQPLDKYLISKTSKEFTKYNLSDVFETVGDNELILTFQQIIKTARNKAKLIYWNHFVNKQHPDKFDGSVVIEQSEVNKLQSIDRGFFYTRLIVESIDK